MNEHENGLPLGGDETPEVPALPVEPAVTEEIVPAEPAEVLPEEPAEELPAEPVEEVPAESVEELPEESAEPMAEETVEEVTGISFEVFDESAVPEEAPKKPKVRKKFPWIPVLVGLLILAVIVEGVLLAGAFRKGNGIVSTTINDRGELVVTYSNGTEENLGRVVGADGSDGKDGMDGADGTGGASAMDVTKAVRNGLRSSVSVYCVFEKSGMNGRPTEYSSAGSGVIYRLNRSEGDAFIITNYHVVYDKESTTKDGIAKEINVLLYGSEFSGMEMKATYVGGSMYYDIAILRLEDCEALKSEDLTAVTMADSDLLQAGTTAIAIGNAEASGISTSFGVVSVPSEYITMTGADGRTSVDYRVIRVDAAVNHGNSGGGLFDGTGRLIGIVNAKTVDEEVENIGYALPSNVVKAVADNIIDFCYGKNCTSVMRPIMGVTITTTESKAEYTENGVFIRETIVIYEVSPGQIGSVFQVDDELVSMTLNGVTKMISQRHHVIDTMVTSRPGDVVDFVIIRNGKQMTVSVTITEDCLTAY